MKETEIRELAEDILGLKSVHGHLIEFANEIYRRGYKDGAASMRKALTPPDRPTKPRVPRKKPAPAQNTELAKALDALLPKPRKK